MSRGTNGVRTRLEPLDDRRSTTALLVTQDAGRAGRVAAAMDGHGILTTVVLSTGHAFLCLDRTTVDVVLVDLDVSEPAPALIRAVVARSDAPVLAFGPPALADPALYQAGMRVYVDDRLGSDAIAAQAEILVTMTSSPRPEGEVGCAGVVIDLDRRELRVEGTPVEVTPLQLRLLATLAAADGGVVTRDELYRAVWGSAPDDGGERLATAVYRLRGRIEAAGSPGGILASVRGEGYRLDETVHA